MGKIKEHALRELKIIGYKDDNLKDEINKDMYDRIISMVEKIDDLEDTAFEYATRVFNKISNKQLLAPISDSEDEWTKDGDVWKNVRDERIVSEDAGKTWKVQEEPKQEEPKEAEPVSEEEPAKEGESVKEDEPAKEEPSTEEKPTKKDEAAKEESTTEAEEK